MEEEPSRICTKCGERKPLSEFYRRKVVKSGVQSHCKKCVTYWRNNVYYVQPDKLAARRRAMNAFHKRLKEEIIREYGGRCVCCGETIPEFLSIDHKDGSGSKHREMIGAGSFTLYKFLKRNGFPKDNYQLLCMNCNCAKGFHGICPHETARQAMQVDAAEFHTQLTT